MDFSEAFLLAQGWLGLAWAWLGLGLGWHNLQYLMIFYTIPAVLAILAIMASLALAIMGMQLGIIVAIVRILPLRRGSLGITGILEGFSLT